MIEIVPARPEHVLAIVEHLRERDRGAISDEKEVVRALARSFVAWTGLVDGQPAAMWGAFTVGLFDDEAEIWFIGTELSERYPLALLRRSRGAIKEFERYFKRLRGHVFCDFEKSVKWLEWLGFEVGPEVNGIREFRSN